MIYHDIPYTFAFQHFNETPISGLGFFFGGGDVWVRPRNSSVRRPLDSELSDFTEESKDHLVMALASELLISSRPRPQQRHVGGSVVGMDGTSTHHQTGTYQIHEGETYIPPYHPWDWLV